MNKINKKSKTMFTAALMGVLLYTQASSGFVYLYDEKIQHPDSSVIFHVNLPGLAASGFPYLPAWERALEDWNLATPVDISWVVDETADSCNTDDAISAVAFVKNFCGKENITTPFMSPRLIPLPHKYGPFPSTNIYREFSSTDISFSDTATWWLPCDPPKCFYHRDPGPDGLNLLARVSRHEIGHALGLGHSIFFGSTLLHGGYLHPPSADDICGVNLLYDNPEGCSLLLGASATESTLIKEANFTGGASADRGETYQSSFSPDDAISVFATVLVEDDHASRTGWWQLYYYDEAKLQEGHLYVLLALEDGSLFAKTSDGAFVPVGDSLETLPAYQTKNLELTNEIIVFEEFVPSSVGMANQTFNVYIGYALAENPSNIYYSSKPITVHINETP